MSHLFKVNLKGIKYLNVIFESLEPLEGRLQDKDTVKDFLKDSLSEKYQQLIMEWHEIQ